MRKLSQIRTASKKILLRIIRWTRRILLLFLSYIVIRFVYSAIYYKDLEGVSRESTSHIYQGTALIIIAVAITAFYIGRRNERRMRQYMIDHPQ
jgi:hypothetical protein